MANPNAGFREVEHTADWELEVWAPDYASLFEQAARGMYVLSDTRLEASPRKSRILELSAPDPESLLVTFLSELLYLAERERIGFDRFDLRLENHRLVANLEGSPLASQSKEIKAVTFHNLAIRKTRRGLEANIVFDV